MHHYSRQEVCALSGIDDERFKTLARRKQIPTCNRKHEINARWAGFSTIEVLCIAVGESLRAEIGGEKGMTAESAMTIAAGARERIASAARNPKRDIWIGTVASRMPEWNSASRTKTGWRVVGTIAEIAKQIEGERAHGDSIRLFAVNVGTVLREVHERARRARIYFPEFLDDAAG